SVFGADLFNEVRGQWAKDEEPGKANTNLPEAVIRQSGRTILTMGRNNFSPRETTIKRWQVADTPTHARGAHTFKAGFDVNRDKIKNFFAGHFRRFYTITPIDIH